MMVRRLAFGVSLLLFGCARPALPPADIVQPPPAAPEVTEPTPAEPPVSVEGGTAQGGFVRPDDGSAFQAGETVTVELQPGPEYLLFVDGQPPQVVSGEAPAASLDGLAAGPHLLRAAPLQDGVPQLGEADVAVRSILVGATPDGATVFDQAGAMLTVGRPYGTVQSEADGQVPFDVRVDGALVSPTGARVKWSVDGQPAGDLSQLPPPEPLTLGPLAPGEHTLEVWLENGDGTTPTNGGLERVKRTFTVEAKPVQPGPII